MKLWIDDVRQAPEGYEWIKTVSDAKFYCCLHIHDGVLTIEEIDLDHDAGDFQQYGGDYIELLNWLEELQFTEGLIIPTKFHIHSGNPVGCQRMWQIIKHCGWDEITYEWE